MTADSRQHDGPPWRWDPPPDDAGADGFEAELRRLLTAHADGHQPDTARILARVRQRQSAMPAPAPTPAPAAAAAAAARRHLLPPFLRSLPPVRVRLTAGAAIGLAAVLLLAAMISRPRSSVSTTTATDPATSAAPGPDRSRGPIDASGTSAPAAPDGGSGAPLTASSPGDDPLGSGATTADPAAGTATGSSDSAPPGAGVPGTTAATVRPATTAPPATAPPATARPTTTVAPASAAVSVGALPASLFVSATGYLDWVVVGSRNDGTFIYRKNGPNRVLVRNPPGGAAAATAPIDITWDNGIPEQNRSPNGRWLTGSSGAGVFQVVIPGADGASQVQIYCGGSVPVTATVALAGGATSSIALPRRGSGSAGVITIGLTGAAAGRNVTVTLNGSGGGTMSIGAVTER